MVESEIMRLTLREIVSVFKDYHVDEENSRRLSAIYSSSGARSAYHGKNTEFNRFVKSLSPISKTKQPQRSPDYSSLEARFN